MSGATFQIFEGDAKTLSRMIPADSIDAVITSPPYWGLRRYGGEEGMIGLEPEFATYVGRLVEIFREIRRALAPAGSLWLNLGDLYAGRGGMKHAPEPGGGPRVKTGGERVEERGKVNLPPGCLVGLPWRVAFALVDDGWILRQSIVWAKPSPMPESVKNRCTRSHEMLFHFAKAPGYYWDHAAMQEPATTDPDRTTRNRRDVWTIGPKRYAEAHFAVFPPDLVRPCIRATVPPDGLVLDPFAGAGTTLVVALEEGRHSIGFEINPEYIKLATERIEKRRAELATGYAAGEIGERIARNIEPHDTGAALDFDPPDIKEGTA